MVLNIQDDILKLHSMRLLDKLLLDKTTKRRIMWATDAYTGLGPRYGRNEEIAPELITGPNASVIKTRARKEMELQSSRTRQRGEVFTPLWVCKKMCDYADKMWGSKARWQRYVDARVLEITCGEAPFLVSRYDVETGEVISIPDRIGLLDRKLQAVNENTQTEEDWLNWAFRAFRATYGYEFQGDNLLISRVNLLMTFEEYLLDRWKRKPILSEYGRLITIIVWNIWQMNGLSRAIPYGTAEEEFQEIDWFGMLGSDTAKDVQPRCRIKNWLGDRSVEFHLLPIVGGNHAMKFNFIIGNPPYQEETESDSTRMPPIYNNFMDQAYEVSDKVMLITPARFLFNAGYTPTFWNEKMLNDPHLKVVLYEQNSANIFPNTDIMGGIAITYRDTTKDFGAIKTFTAFDELNSILKKVRASCPKWIEDSIYSTLSYKLSGLMRTENPDSLDRLRTSAFEKLSEIFFENIPDDNHEYVSMVGLLNGKRTQRWVRRDYLVTPENFDFYKVVVPAANGSKPIGNSNPTVLIGQPFVADPAVGHTQTFISFGKFDTKNDAEACLKYIKSKFARVMLGILKITQHNPGPKWKYVPLQDFTSTSDIDWTKSISEIDQQLYRKYGLDETEVQFIETHVKEMA